VGSKTRTGNADSKQGSTSKQDDGEGLEVALEVLSGNEDELSQHDGNRDAHNDVLRVELDALCDCEALKADPSTSGLFMLMKKANWTGTRRSSVERCKRRRLTCTTQRMMAADARRISEMPATFGSNPTSPVPRDVG
jgi:hypothetical protein